jgi:hypothetical protein
VRACVRACVRPFVWEKMCGYVGVWSCERARARARLCVRILMCALIHLRAHLSNQDVIFYSCTRIIACVTYASGTCPSTNGTLPCSSTSGPATRTLSRPSLGVCARALACVHERERKTERQRQRQRQREGERERDNGDLDAVSAIARSQSISLSLSIYFILYI